jgi:hypothetical protein
MKKHEFSQKISSILQHVRSSLASNWMTNLFSPQMKILTRFVAISLKTRNGNAKKKRRRKKNAKIFEIPELRRVAFCVVVKNYIPSDLSLYLTPSS